ncbi:MAG TPA: hypothetical protein VI030_06545 [Propionibacteriaceae bacterium]
MNKPTYEPVDVRVVPSGLVINVPHGFDDGACVVIVFGLVVRAARIHPPSLHMITVSSSPKRAMSAMIGRRIPKGCCHYLHRAVRLDIGSPRSAASARREC